MKNVSKLLLASFTTIAMSGCSDGGGKSVTVADASTPIVDGGPVITPGQSSGSVIPASLAQFSDTKSDGQRSTGTVDSDEEPIKAVIEGEELLIEDYAGGRVNLLGVQFEWVASEINMLDRQLRSYQFELEAHSSDLPLLERECPTSGDGEVCDIPISALSAWFEENSGDSQLDENGDPLNEESGLPKSLQYIRNTQDGYDHQKTEIYQFSEDSSETQYRWNTDLKKGLVGNKDNWVIDGVPTVFTSQLAVDETGTDRRISFTSNYSEEDRTTKNEQQVRFLGDAKNTVEVQSKTTSVSDDHTLTTTTSYSANTEGGQLTSAALAVYLGTEDTMHSRYEFNAAGEITTAEGCYAAGGVDCSVSENWIDISGDAFFESPEMPIEPADPSNPTDPVDPGHDRQLPEFSEEYTQCIDAAFESAGDDLEEISDELNRCEDLYGPELSDPENPIVSEPVEPGISQEHGECYDAAYADHEDRDDINAALDLCDEQFET